MKDTDTPVTPRRIPVPADGMESLVGPLDENLKTIEATFSVRLRTTGNDVLVEGDPDDVAKAERVLEQLTSMMRDGHAISSADVKTATRLVEQDETVEVKDVI